MNLDHITHVTVFPDGAVWVYLDVASDGSQDFLRYRGEESAALLAFIDQDALKLEQHSAAVVEDPNLLLGYQDGQKLTAHLAAWGVGPAPEDEIDAAGYQTIDES